MTVRRTVVVHTRLAGHMARVAAARAGENGVQIMTMGQLAGRLAGGFTRPIDPEALQDAVRASLATVSLGELEAIKTLPGMVRAAVGTLDKVWRAGIDLGAGKHPRLAALSLLEEEVLRRLPPSMKRPKEMVELACARIGHALAALGPIEVSGHSEMAPCWRPLLAALAAAVPVAWIAGPRPVPAWVRAMKFEVRSEQPSAAEPKLISCAHPQHEVLEAFRWIRKLLAGGSARPEDIAIVAANPADFDDHVLALSRDANLAVHFVHGIKAVTTRDGQTAAALAEVLVKGISQERVRRLFALLHDKSPATAGLPRDWARVLPKDAPLTTVERWEKALPRDGNEWPGGVDRSDLVLGILRLVERGTGSAQEAGEHLLPKLALRLWQRALDEGPPAALPVTLTHLRVHDGLEPASQVIWTSAISLASAPRPYARLLALNAGRWPRRISEDRLIPDHVIPIEDLDPLPIAEADERDFGTIVASARSATISYSRRDVEGRLLGRSPLIADIEEETYLARGRIPEHAASESDRLLARPGEFRATPIAVSGRDCWRDWFRNTITAHDGLVPRSHARLSKVLQAPMSATSLRLLLRDPIRFVWRYALGWRQPEEVDEPLTLDPLARGNLVHAALQQAVDMLEQNGGLARAKPAAIARAVEDAIAAVAQTWESEQPVPPAVVWRNALATAREFSVAALMHPHDKLAGQKSWTEVPFGAADEAGRNDLPWDPEKPVEIPGTGIRIHGHIDRLDVAGDGARARVIDYKTGRLDRNMAEVVIKGGSELQRCLYAFAVKTLLGRKIGVEASLLYPREQAAFPLADVDSALDQLATAIRLARASLENGLALPGKDAADHFNDFAFALPAGATYLARKKPLAEARLGDATRIWEAK